MARRFVSFLLLLWSLAVSVPVLAQDAVTTTAQARQRLEQLKADPTSDPSQVRTVELTVLTLEELDGVRAKLSASRSTVVRGPMRETALKALLDQGGLPPDAPPKAEEGKPVGLDVLQAGLQATVQQVEARTRELESLDQRVGERIDQRQGLLVELADATRELERVRARQSALASLPTTDPGAGDLRDQQAAQVRLQTAKQDLARSRIEELDLQRRLLPLERDLVAKELKALKSAQEVWNQAVSDARQAEVERVQTAVAELRTQQQGDLRVPSIDELLKRVTSLTQERSELSGTIRVDAQRLQQLRLDQADLRQRLSQARIRVRSVGLNERMGDLLRSELDALPLASDLGKEERDVHERLSETLARLAEVQDELRHVQGLDAETDLLIRALSGRSDLSRSLPVLLELDAHRHGLEEGLQRDLSDHADDLVDLERLLKEHLATVREFREFIHERVLWTRSTSAGTLRSLAHVPDALLWLVDPKAWGAWPGQLAAAFPDETFGGMVLVLLSFALLRSRKRILRRIEGLNKLVRSYRTDHFRLTVLGVALTFALALTWPLFMLGLSRTLELRGLEGTVVHATGAALRRMQLYVFVLQFLEVLLRADGVASVQFRWGRERCLRVRRLVRWNRRLTFPPFLLATVLVIDGDAQRIESLGRSAFVLAMAVLAVFSLRLLRTVREGRSPGKGIVMRMAWYGPLALAVMPLVATVAGATGWFYTADRLAQKLLSTAVVCVGVLLLAAVIDRRLFLTRRKLAVEQARSRARAEDETGFDEEKVDLPTLDAQTRQLSRFGLLVLTVVALNGIWRDVLPALRMLDRAQVWPEVAWLPDPELTVRGPSLAPVVSLDPSASAVEGGEGASPEPSGAPTTGFPVPLLTSDSPAATDDGASPTTLTLGDLLQALTYLLMTFIAVRNLPGALEILLLVRLPLDRGTRNAVTTLSRYAIAILGAFLAFGAIGIGWSKVQWLAAAMTFGLAFGLQEIFANFISGLIILVDRPVRPGDVVTVGGVDGRVARVQLRATTIVDWDQREFLVPNKEFITGSVINWTLSDPVTRIVIPVGVAYGSDLAVVRRELLATTQGVPGILLDPEPTVLFRGFGDSTLNFELRCWVAEFDDRLIVSDMLLVRIDQHFRDAGVEIAFPQLDLHIKRS